MEIQGIASWLSPITSTASDGKYRHRLLLETAARWRDVEAGIKAYFRHAHADAVRRLRRLAGGSLHPLRPSERAADPACGYPHRLPTTALKGCFGEVFAAVLATHYAPFDLSEWEVPAFLFRYHLVAFQQLEACRQTGAEPEQIPGRTGDDSLAFRRDEVGRIISVLYCESKCSAGHDAGLIADAHRKVGQSPVVDVLQLIEVLEDAETPEAERWVASLRRFHAEGYGPTCERIDFVCYICGRRPVQEASWIPPNRPHQAYGPTGRRLEAVEVHLIDPEATIRAVYSPEGWS